MTNALLRHREGLRALVIHAEKIVVFESKALLSDLEAGPTMRGYFCAMLGAVLAAVFLQGCAANGNGRGDPGARALPLGSSCDSIRGELNKLDGRGVPALVERASNGGKLNAQQQGDVDRYNGLLNQYLGARCHV